MSEQEQAEMDPLEAAIAENPEEVAAFVDRLGLVNELLDATELVTAAADDRMVVDTANTAASLAEAADGLATAETAELGEAVGENGDDLADALETVVRLQRSGALDELAKLAEVVPLVSVTETAIVTFGPVSSCASARLSSVARLGASRRWRSARLSWRTLKARSALAICSLSRVS